MQTDYIVIGAGSSGCVVANRLSAPGGGSVLLLEAGGASRSPRYRMPLAATKLWFDPGSSWSLFTEPEPGLDGRRLPVPRGRALGGSSAINGTIYNRGSPHDYDQRRDAGLTGWDFASLLPYFRRIEHHWRGADAFHGAGGEVPVTRPRHPSRFAPAVLEAARQMGLPVTDDFLGPDSEGIGIPDLNVNASGRRVSAADAFLTPIRARTSLTVHTRAQVTRIRIEAGSAVGVAYLHNGAAVEARAAREIILCAGAIASPYLLLLSGIGPADELARIDVAPVHDLPAVSRDLTDQPGAGFEIATRLPHSFAHSLRADRFAFAMLQWALGFGGPASGPPMVAMGALRTQKTGRFPDMRLVVASATMQSKVWVPGIGPPPTHRLLANCAVAHPQSRGSVSLASLDPGTPPAIRFNLLTAAADVDRLRACYRLLRDLFRQPAAAALTGPITRPSPEPADDAALDAYLRAACGTTSHPMGSCRMGVDTDAVVDPTCRVRGIDALRVVDASVSPTQISGNPTPRQ